MLRHGRLAARTPVSLLPRAQGQPAGPSSPGSPGHPMAPLWQELGTGKERAVALPGWCCGTRNGLVLTARVPPSSLTLAPARVGDDGRAGGWNIPCASLGGFIAGHEPVCGREVIKWAARSLCPRARSSLLARQLLALPHSSRDAHPEGQPRARTHALPAATSVPGCRPPVHCKATTGAATGTHVALGVHGARHLAQHPGLWASPVCPSATLPVPPLVQSWCRLTLSHYGGGSVPVCLSRAQCYFPYSSGTVPV